MTRRRAPSYLASLVVINATLGLIRLTESANRTQSAAYHYAKQVMPMRWWGAVFLIGAVILLVAAKGHSPLWLQFAACVGVAGWAFWALLLAASAYFDGHSSYAGVVVYAAGAVRHVQVARRR